MTIAWRSTYRRDRDQSHPRQRNLGRTGGVPQHKTPITASTPTPAQYCVTREEEQVMNHGMMEDAGSGGALNDDLGLEVAKLSAAAFAMAQVATERGDYAAHEADARALDDRLAELRPRIEAAPSGSTARARCGVDRCPARSGVHLHRRQSTPRQRPHAPLPPQHRRIRIAGSRSYPQAAEIDCRTPSVPGMHHSRLRNQNMQTGLV